MITASHGGRSSARLERQVVALEVGGSSPLGHPESPAADGGFLPDAAGSLSSVLRDGRAATEICASSSIGRASDS